MTAFKESGVPWIGKIPNHWTVLEPRRLFALRKEPERAGDIHLTPSQKFGVLPQAEYMEKTGARVVLNLSGTTMQHVEPGDFISHLRTFQGGLELAEIPGKVSPAYTVVTPRKDASPGFYKYALKSSGYISQIASITDQLRDGQSMRFSEFNKTWLPAPPMSEQQAIADYLDHETAEIDALIDEILAAIEISQARDLAAITSQICPNIALKPIDGESRWHGPLPDNWKSARLSWVFANIGSGTTPSSNDHEAFDGNVAWVTTGELREGGISSTQRYITQTALERYSALHVYPSGTLLIAMYGATIGRLGWLENHAAVNQAVCAMEGYTAGPTRYPFYALLAARPHLLTLADGGGQPNINQDKIRSLRIPLPPIEEQERIIRLLDAQLEKSAIIAADFARAVTLAKERRAALITAAVTGQIDVETMRKGKSVAEKISESL